MGKKILFLSPAIRSGAGPSRTLFPPLSLGVLAALTPDDWNMRIIDEAVDEIEFDPAPDIVAITSITAVAPRAYQVADEFRRRGSTVVMGGMHPSAMVDEASQHADAVVVGEAEPVWGKLLQDWERGTLQPVYRSERRVDLANLPLPRRDLFNPRGYLTRNTIQTSRGCPFACEFCAVTRFFGRSYRVRPIEDVVREVRSLDSKQVLFVDDNIVGNPSHARNLFEALSSLRINWVGQASLNIASDVKLLKLAAKSGCRALFIGFESLIPENLKAIGKSMVNKVEEFMSAIRRIHSHGIGIEGAFIFGFDQDDDETVRRTVQFAKRARLEAAQFGILTPFPGTPIYDRMEREGRICDRDWLKYSISKVVFEPRQISRESLSRSLIWAYREFYSYKSILSRLIPAVKRDIKFFLPVNIGFRRIAFSMRAE